MITQGDGRETVASNVGSLLRKRRRPKTLSSGNVGAFGVKGEKSAKEEGERLQKGKHEEEWPPLERMIAPYEFHSSGHPVLIKNQKRRIIGMGDQMQNESAAEKKKVRKDRGLNL